MNNESKNNVFLTILLCLIAVLGIVFFAKGRNSDENIENTASVSVINPSINITSDKEDIIDNIDDNINRVNPSNDSQNDKSVYEIPFSDGYEFPDLSEFDFVFIGDSIFDMNGSIESIPRQLEVYTKARVYNLSKNTSCAGDNSNGYISLPKLTDNFLAGTQTGISDTYTFNDEIIRFNEDDHQGRRMVIIINHCLNDYLFSTQLTNPNDAYDINTYEGSLRTCISKIKNSYPKATVVYMKPYIIGTNNKGEDTNSYGYKLSDYISKIDAVASEQKIMCFDLREYDAFKEYRIGPLLDDLIHPAPMGSKTIDRLLCDFVINNIK